MEQNYKRIVVLRLKQLLDEKNITQKEFAEMSGIRAATISEMCRNYRSTLNLEHLSVILDTLNIDDVDRLFAIIKVPQNY